MTSAAWDQDSVTAPAVTPTWKIQHILPSPYRSRATTPLEMYARTQQQNYRTPVQYQHPPPPPPPPSSFIYNIYVNGALHSSTSLETQEEVDKCIAYAADVRKRSRPLNISDLSPIKRMIRDELRSMKRRKPTPSLMTSDSYVQIENCKKPVAD